MAAPRSQSAQIQALQTEVALLKQSGSSLEHTVVAQNAAVKTELANIYQVLREIHDKLDRVTLDHSLKLVEQKAEIEANKAEVADAYKEIERVDGKITKAGAVLGGIFTTMLAAMFQWLTPSGK